MSYQLQEFPEKIALVKLAPGAEIPAWAESSSLFSITATATETAIICATRSVPTKTVSHKPLTAFALAAPLRTSHAVALIELLTALVEVEIDAFTVNTYDTVWLLVPKARAEAAAEEWRRRGHNVAPAVPVTPARKGKK